MVARLLWEQEVAGSNPVSPTRSGDLRLSEKTIYLSLYRRWRPKRFVDVVGQAAIVRTLRNVVVAGEVGHAYLFAGERGIGKTSVARILARAVNCLAPTGGEPCNSCANCQTILLRRSLDILEIDGASNRGIDHIRRLREEVSFAPTALEKKVYIIDEVHMLTNEAFNALLKTLEEPPAHAMFIFATTEPHKIPLTIVSRCQVLNFRKISTEIIAAHLSEIARSESVTISKEAVVLLAHKANGGMRDAIVLLEQAMNYGQGDIDAGAVIKMLGMAHPKVREEFLSAVEKGNRGAVLTIIDSLAEQGKDLELFLSDLTGVLRDRIAGEGGCDGCDVRLCHGLLRVKQELFHSLDHRILMEIGILELMNELGLSQEPSGAEHSSREGEGLPEHEENTVDDSPAEHKAKEETGSHEEASLSSIDWWEEMLGEIQQERIAIAAFLAEATPHLEGERLTIAFHPEHTFHKESLEKTGNMQYLSGMVHRRLGDQFYVDVKLDGEVMRKPSPREKLREKAELVRQMFDGKVVKED